MVPEPRHRRRSTACQGEREEMWNTDHQPSTAGMWCDSACVRTSWYLLTDHFDKSSPSPEGTLFSVISIIWIKEFSERSTPMHVALKTGMKLLMLWCVFAHNPFRPLNKSSPSPGGHQLVTPERVRPHREGPSSMSNDANSVKLWTWKSCFVVRFHVFCFFALAALSWMR